MAARHNVTTPLVSKLSGGLHLERLEVSRLRATWVAQLRRADRSQGLHGRGGDHLLAAARRRRLVPARLSEQEMVALLGATS